jgi:peptide/nickel transport system substrate-binding protein/oligopeptide transport system substrate-binding protein
VAGLRALDDYTLEITLSQPYAPFIAILGMPQASVVPREEVARLGEQFGRQPIGTGPFSFVTWEPEKSIVLQANENYFEGRPFLDGIHYRIFTTRDIQTVLAAFEKHEIEDTPIPAPDLQRLRDNPQYRFFSRPLLATLFLWLNTRNSALQQRSVRQAINYAINRTAMNSIIRNNRFEQARGMLPLGMPGYNPHLVGYPYDPERARQLLAEAGYPDGQGLPPLALWSSVKSPEAQAEHEAIKRDLQAVGITLELHTAESWQRFEADILGKPPGALYRYAWYADFPDPDNFLFVLFHSQSATNFAHYSNPEVDRLLEQAQRENDYLKRVTLYREAETIILADAPTVNLLYYTFEHLFQPYVMDVEISALGERHIPMKKIWLDRSHHAFSTLAKRP